jgi:hypothetical protein
MRIKNNIFIFLLIILVFGLGTLVFFISKPTQRSETENFIPGELTIIFDDNFSLERAEKFIKENNFDNITDLYDYAPSFKISPPGVCSYIQDERDIEDLQKKTNGTDLEFSYSVNNFKLSFEKFDFEKIKKMFTNYDCLSKLNWKLDGNFDIYNQDDNKKVKVTQIEAEFNPVEISGDFLKKIENNNLIEGCESSDYGYISCECKRGTLKMDIENLISHFDGVKILEINVDNTVKIKVPEGEEKKWKDYIQSKLGKDGTVDFSYQLKYTNL